jgi:hypothetical protein
VVKHGSGVVEDVAVELTERDDQLQRVAERVIVGDEGGGNEGARTPEGLSYCVSTNSSVCACAEMEKTYSSDSLHAEHKGVLGQIARVAQAVLLPQLAKQVLHAAHGAEVVGKVALEEGVDAAAEHKPHDGGQVAVAERRSDALDERVRDAEDGGTAGGKHADQLKRVPFVGEVARDLGLDGVVGVVLAREEGEVACCHGAGWGL